LIGLDNINQYTHNKGKTYYGQLPTLITGGSIMPNITLSVDDEIIKKVRKIAIDKNTTLTAMVRQFLTSVAAMDAQEKNDAVKRLRKSFINLSCDMSRRSWTREDLHER
jgi:hypothetical protein